MAQAAIKAAGGKFLAAGGKTTTIEGEPPKARVVIQQWDSVEKIQAYRRFSGLQRPPAAPQQHGEVPQLSPLRGYLNSCSDNRRAGLKAALLAGGLLPSRHQRATTEL